MIHSNISPYIELENNKISIREAATKTIQFFQELAKTESKFNSISIISEQKPLYESINIFESNSIELLSEEILHRNLKEIRKKCNQIEINSNYSEAEILNFALTSKYNESETILTLFFSFTTSTWVDSKIGTIVSHHNYFSNQNNCIYFLKASVRIFNPKYAVIRPTKDKSYSSALAKYKHNSKLGNFTYYNNNIGYKIPLDYNKISKEELINGTLYNLNSVDNSYENLELVINFMELFEQLDTSILK